MKGVELSTGFQRAVCSVCRPRRPRSDASKHLVKRIRYPVSSASFSTSPTRRATDLTPASNRGIAAAPFSFGGDSEDSGLLKRVRVVPASPSYFSGKPDFTDSLLSLQALLRKYQTLPTVPAGQAPRVAWKTLAQFRLSLSEPVKAAKYHKIVEVLHRLNHIHPSLMPEEVLEALQKHKRDINPFENVANPRFIDGYGRAWGTGRRKASVATACVVEGEGEVLVNGKTLTQFFGRLHDRESVIWALKSTQRIDKYNIWALVKGGGTTGQAEALTLAVGKALMVHEPLLKPALRRAGCVTRDPRRVERKKPGHVKARKMPTWVKR
ncbi:hypothetical protein W97_01373 [Coniosporium apollinis CBS 100218]|uniref:Small ribosomal subunit protein uS9m n=1 Tax=Coniosporium apollinis (strain CBS 100218) TaxID=1168221 RepID=R7YK31_CONA1|nr:uncharacterized protein W97_01373 [Coniosporium apollinis CBS 100218]EON62154.1 hypothetical protein W97_01373 [Coniosporium apollinis CBS 100218]